MILKELFEDDSDEGRIYDETAVSLLMDRFAETLTPLEDACATELRNQTKCMQANQLKFFAPALGRFPELLLEQSLVRTSLLESFHSLRNSESVKIVRFDGFPSRELELGLQNLPKSIERVEIIHTNRSQSISVEALYHLPTTLRLFQCDARIVIRHAKECEQLAASLGTLTHLRHLEIHILPRLRQNSMFRLDALLQNLSSRNLQILKFTAGYEHNYHTVPLIAERTLRDFFQRVTSLAELQLDNFGLRDIHLQFIPHHLKKLRLAAHHPNAFRPNQFLLEDSQLEECIFWTETEAQVRKSMYSEFHAYQEQLHLHCLIRKCWKTGDFANAIHTAATSTHRMALSALYAIVRFNPSLLK